MQEDEPEEEPQEEVPEEKPDDASTLSDSDLDDDSVAPKEEAPEPKEYVPQKKVLSCVRFAIDSQVLVTGDGSGSVDVYKIFGMLPMNRARVLGLELERLSKAMQPDPMNKQA